MSGLRRGGVGVWGGAGLVVAAAARGDGVEAVGADVPEPPPGLRRLAWRAGGVRLIVREALMRRRIGNVMLFAVVAAAAAWAAWPASPGSPGSPGSRGSLATPVDRV